MRHANPQIDELRAHSEANRLYFGYGSTLNATDYATNRRQPLKFLSVALAPDVSLVFDRYSEHREGGVLSLGDAPGAVIQGALFEVDDTNWRELDDKEGGSSGRSTRVPIRILVRDEYTGEYQEVLAQTYVTTNPGGFHSPSSEYLQICWEGRVSIGLNTRDLTGASKNQPNGFRWQNHRIFTYGTLCRGEFREPVMRSCPIVHVGLAEVHGMRLFRNTGEAYPCLVPGGGGEPNVPVIGDLWRFPASWPEEFVALTDLFRQLDAIEGDVRPTLRELATIARAEMRFSEDFGAGSKAARRHLENAMASSLFRRTLVHVKSGGRGRGGLVHFDSVGRGRTAQIPVDSGVWYRRAWAYLYVRETAGLLPITSGNWRKYVGRWDAFLLRQAEAYIEKAGGLEAFRSLAIEHFAEHLARIADAADLARMLDHGQTGEQELVETLGLMNDRGRSFGMDGNPLE